MKFTKSQYKKLEGLMPIARKLAKISNYKFMCAMLYIKKMVANGGHCQKNMETGTQFI